MFDHSRCGLHTSIGVGAPPARGDARLAASQKPGIVLLAACGDDTSTSTGEGGAGGESTTTTDAGSTGTTTANGGGGSGDGGSGDGGAPPEVACGDLTCTGGDTCIETTFEPDCTNLLADEMCPEGTTESNCGGDGAPCCCEPPPDSEYTCATTTCGGEEALCLCLDAPCEEPKQCVEVGAAGTVRCEEPAVP